MSERMQERERERERERRSERGESQKPFAFTPLSRGNKFVVFGKMWPGEKKKTISVGPWKLGSVGTYKMWVKWSGY